MRRTAMLLALALVAFLLDAPEVQAGSGQAGEFLSGKISGPAISTTIVIDPTHVSPASPSSPSTNVNPTKGQTAVRLQLKAAGSGAIFTHLQAAQPVTGVGWVLGCDGTKGALSPDPNFNVTTLTQIRFLNQPLRSWMPGDVITALLFGSVQEGGLGLAAPTNLVPGITDISSPVCTTIVEGGLVKYILSFFAVIQFAEGPQ